jgi:FKBP-type peptidyl-prolyl cis-trans isomerase FkpA
MARGDPGVACSAAIAGMSNRNNGSILGCLLALVLVVNDAAAQQEAQDAASPASAQSTRSSAAIAADPLDGFAAIGSDMAMANHLNEMRWSDAQISAFIDGIRAAFRGKPVPPNDAARQIGEKIAQQIAETEARQRELEFAKPGRLKEYLKELCKRLNLDQSDSGLCYGIQAGMNGTRPGPDDTVVVSCAAFAADGATPIPVLTNQKARIKVSDMLPGFVEGVQMMSTGGQAVFVLPPALSFGSGKWPPGVDRGTPLLFRITLIEVISASRAH